MRESCSCRSSLRRHFSQKRAEKLSSSFSLDDFRKRTGASNAPVFRIACRLAVARGEKNPASEAAGYSKTPDAAHPSSPLELGRAEHETRDHCGVHFLYRVIQAGLQNLRIG